MRLSAILVPMLCLAGIYMLADYLGIINLAPVRGYTAGQLAQLLELVAPTELGKFSKFFGAVVAWTTAWSIWMLEHPRHRRRN